MKHVSIAYTSFVLFIIFGLCFAFYGRHELGEWFTEAYNHYENQEYEACFEALDRVGLQYNGAAELCTKCHYAYGVSSYKQGKYYEAIEQFAYDMSYADTASYIKSMLKEE